MTQPQIFDRGYRRFEGPRTGKSGAFKSLVIYSVRSSLGLGRAARHKLFPAAVIVFAFVPAVVFIGVAALLPDELVTQEELLPTYSEYYNFVIADIFLFAGFVAPELLCTDRRTSMLGVYLASPLSRTSYVLGKAVSTLLMVLTVTLGPPLLFLIARSLQNLGPDGFGDWIATFGRIVLSSIIIGSVYSAIALVASSMTDRRAVASAATLLTIPGSAVITDLLVVDANFTPHLRLLNLLYLPRALVFRVFGETSEGWPRAENPTASLWLAWIAVVGLSAFVVWFRYQRLLVRR